MYIIEDSIREKEYCLKEQLGRGSFGICYLAFEITSHNNFACKKVNDLVVFKSEVRIQAKISHRNIVQLVSSFVHTRDNYILMELCSNGNLKDLIDNCGPLRNPDVRCIIKQVVDGLQYLHSLRIVHRDLTVSNILLTSAMDIKIADFGLAVQLKNNEEVRMSVSGTLNYISPEVILELGHGFSVDIWALGCCMYFLLVGREPFFAETEEETLHRITMVQFHPSEKLQTKALQFLQTLFVTEPGKRPDAFTVLNHKYFTTGFTPVALPPLDILLLKAEEAHTSLPLKDITNTGGIKSMENMKGIYKITGKENVEITKVKHKMILRPRKCDIDSKINLKPAKDISIDTQLKIEIVSTKPLLKTLQMLLKKEVLLSGDFKVEHPKTICVSRWAGFLPSGFGYHLNNGCLGIRMPDGSQFLRRHGGEMFHFPVEGRPIKFKQDKVPPGLVGLVECAKTVHSHLLTLQKFGSSVTSTKQIIVTQFSHFKDRIEGFMNTAMYLSNGTCQINFSNHEKIVVSQSDNLILVYGKSGEYAYSLDVLLREGLPVDLRGKIQFAISFLKQIIH